MWTEIGWGRPLPGADGQFCLPTTAIHSSSGSWVWAKLVFHYLYSFSLKENIAQKAQRTRELSAFAKSTYPFWSERERLLWKRSNIHDIRVRASFQKKEKKERILLEISNIHDIRVGASFQKKDKKGKDISGDIEYTTGCHSAFSFR